MKKILINGLNAKSGGGKSILNNYLKILKKASDENKYYVLTPYKNDYLQYQSINIDIIDIPSFYKKQFLLPFTYIFVLKNIVKSLNIDSIFNLADIPIATKTYQVFLFDWPYAVYPKSAIWNLMSNKDFFTRKFKLYLFNYLLKYVDSFIAQTEVIEKRLINFYNCSPISVIPNAITLESFSHKASFDFKLPSGKKILYLSYYYPHKNFEIFLKLGTLIKQRNLDFKIIITIDRSQNKRAIKFLNKLDENGLNDIVVNIGPIDTKYISSLYSQVDGLLMPTLLETYGLPYIEAFHNNKPVFTSDIDFSHAVCGDAAKYFNPFDELDILEKLEISFSDENEIKKMQTQGQVQLMNIMSWIDVFKKYQNLILKD